MRRPFRLRPSVAASLLLAVFGIAFPTSAGAQPEQAPADDVEARNTEMAHRFIDEVYVARDFDRIPEFIAADFVDHSPGAPEHARGTDFVRVQAEGTRAGFPDFAFEALRTVAEGDLVAIHWKMTGTSSEQIAGPAAAGKAVDVQGISMFRYDDAGKVVESWDLVDRAGMLEQLGFTFVPPGAAAGGGGEAGGGDGEGDGEGDGR